MIVTSCQTRPVIAGDSLLAILDESLPELSERTIIAVTSKIVSICEGAIVKNDGTTDKHTLIKQEADRYLDIPLSQAYGITITIKNHLLVANAGIDESNGNGYFVLWPRDPFRSASIIWKHIRQRHRLKQFGVIITDSHIIPLQWGTRGRAIAWCGLAPLKNYIGTPDIFGKRLHATKASVVDSLAGAAVAVMGEGNEQTPLALITDVPFVEFIYRPPTRKEISSLTIDPAKDIYSPLLTSARWKNTNR